MNKPKITNEMVSKFSGHFTFKLNGPCPKCALYLDQHCDGVECLCGGSEERSYQKEMIVPWDLCKDIYKKMTLEANREL